MKFSALITACQFPDLKWIARSGESAEVQLCLPAHIGDVTLRAALYVGRAEALPPPLPGACYLITNGTDVDPNVESNYSACDIVSTSLSAEEAYWAAAQCLAEEQQLNAARAELIDTMSSGAGLQTLIDVAFHILGNPIVVVDSGFKILAYNEAVTQFRPDLAEQQKLGYMLEANIESMRRNQVYEKTRARNYPYYSIDPNSEAGWITALVYADGIEVAQIGIVEMFREFTHSDFEIIDFLCRVVSMELQKSDFSVKNSGHMHSLLMKDLLDRLVSDEESAMRRATALGWANSGDQYVLVIYDQRDTVFDRKARIVSETLQHILPYSRWVLYDNRLVFFLPHKPDSWDSLQEYLRVNQLSGALSDTFTGLLPIRFAYLQALRAFEIGSQLRSDARLYQYTDYLFQHMGQVLQEHRMLTPFCHPVVDRIAAYDKEHHSELLPTLRAYLQHVEQPAQAAKSLFIHKNTLFYRIGRIRELFGLDLSSGHERARLLLTMAFMDI